MTEQTASDVVAFIQKNCGGNEVLHDWFDGEPTAVKNQINRICRKLGEAGTTYNSRMTTNGYLFDAEPVQKAVTLWYLKRVMIAVDGVNKLQQNQKLRCSERYPRQRVMRNIDLR